VLDFIPTEAQVLGGGGLVGFGVWYLQKTMTMWRAEGAQQAKAQAEAEQFKNLQEAIAANNKDMAELRAQFAIMDRKIHTQQRTITRMEMLLRQFSGLVRQHGTPVPDYMQEELESLIDSDIERSEGK
jgi:uncharacterized protein HemX